MNMIKNTSPIPMAREPGSGFVPVFMLGFALFVAIWAFVPQVGVVFRIHSIAASSMSPNLNTGGHAVVNLAAYGYGPESFEWFRLPMAGRFPSGMPARGDIVTFRSERVGQGSVVHINRVIGLPGDRIQMIAGRLWINGKIVERLLMQPVATLSKQGKIIQFPQWQETLPDGPRYRVLEMEGDKGVLDNTSVFDVPAGHLFMLGDNRDNSADSRIALADGGVGLVPVTRVTGKLVRVFGGQLRIDR